VKADAAKPLVDAASSDRGAGATTVVSDGVAERSPTDADDGRTPAQDLFEEARRRRRRRYLWGTIAVALAVLLVATTAWSLRGGTARAPGPPSHRVGGPHPSGAVIGGMPPAMVVWAQLSPSTMAIQVVSSKTGRVVRTLATDDGLFDSTPQPTVSTDGTVFFDDSVAGSSTPGPGAPPPIERVMAVPFAGGPVSFVALGHDPVVSPNGQDLAYLTFTQVSDAPEAIVVRDLRTGASSTWSYSTNGPDIRRLTWMPDSVHLAFSTEILVRRQWHLSTRVVDVTGSDRRLEDARVLPLPRCPTGPSWAFGTDHTMAWAGFLGEDLGIGICRHVDITGTEQQTQPFVIDVRTGREVARLPAIGGLIGDGPGGGFQIDPSGRYMAYVGPGLGAGGLYRWDLYRLALPDRGPSSRPVFVRQQVGSVGWVPPPLGDPGPTPSAQTPSTLAHQL
jgi:hypothetical protein